MNIGEKIQHLAKSKRMNLENLAQESGVTRQGITNIFKSGDTKISTLGKIANALDTDIAYFFSDPQPEQTNTAVLTITVKATSNANLSPDQINLVSLVKAVYPSKTFHVVDTRPILLQVQDVTLKQ